MPKKKVIHLTGTANANIVLVAKHKKNGSVVLRAYPMQYANQPKRRSPLKEFEVLMGDLNDLPDEVLDAVIKAFGDVKKKRTQKPEVQEAGAQREPQGTNERDQQQSPSTEIKEREVVG